MNLDDIRQNEELTKWWASVFNRKQFQDGIFKMLQDTHPMRFVETGGTTEASATRRLGMIEGYEMALEKLRLAAQYQQPKGEMPPATFTQEPETEEETK